MIQITQSLSESALPCPAELIVLGYNVKMCPKIFILSAAAETRCGSEPSLCGTYPLLMAQLLKTRWARVPYLSPGDISC